MCDFDIFENREKTLVFCTWIKSCSKVDLRSITRYKIDYYVIMELEKIFKTNFHKMREKASAPESVLKFNVYWINSVKNIVYRLVADDNSNDGHSTPNEFLMFQVWAFSTSHR